MKEHPILFSAPMVRAILDGRKTQTRRVVKPQPDTVIYPPATKCEFLAVQFTPEDERLGRLGKTIPCPFGQGDTLWVRENFYQDGQWCLRHGCEPDDRDGRFWSGTSRVLYAADQNGELPPPIDSMNTWRSRPSIHMPRWASRITLEITGVRVERLNKISEEDAVAEGIKGMTKDGRTIKYGLPDKDGLPGNDDDGWHWCNWMSDASLAFKELWKSIHGFESWEANPWVWVIEFKRI